jgi:hypothetical protein
MSETDFIGLQSLNQRTRGEGKEERGEEEEDENKQQKKERRKLAGETKT